MEEKFREKAGNTLKSRERIILIDSSILMYGVKGKKRLPINIESALLDVTEGARLAVLSSTIEELEILRKTKKGKTRIAADFALELIDRLGIHMINVDEETLKKVRMKARKKPKYEFYDEILAEMAEKLGAAVATIDMNLVKKLRRRNITCYYLHGRNWIKVSGFQY